MLFVSAVCTYPPAKKNKKAKKNHQIPKFTFDIPLWEKAEASILRTAYRGYERRIYLPTLIH